MKYYRGPNPHSIAFGARAVGRTEKINLKDCWRIVRQLLFCLYLAHEYYFTASNGGNTFEIMWTTIMTVGRDANHLLLRDEMGGIVHSKTSFDRCRGVLSDLRWVPFSFRRLATFGRHFWPVDSSFLAPWWYVPRWSLSWRNAELEPFGFAKCDGLDIMVRLSVDYKWKRVMIRRNTYSYPSPEIRQRHSTKHPSWSTNWRVWDWFLSPMRGGSTK